MSRRRCLVILRLLLIWLGVWPLAMLGFAVIEQLAPSLSFVLRTLILTGFMVPMIALVVAPLAGGIVARFDSVTRHQKAKEK